MVFDPQALIDEAGALPDGEIDMVCTALALSAPDHPGISVGKYLSHVDKVAADVAARHAMLLREGAADDAGTQLAALKYVMVETEGYDGDKDRYDALENADLMRVIDRRRGLPVALAILYVHVGLGRGWNIAGLNFPGHVLCRIEKDGQRLIFDPFDACRPMQAQDLRALVKKVAGPKAELASVYYEPSGRRELLVRLQNNVKLRRIEAGDYQGALDTVEKIRRLDPREYRLLFDEGILSARVGRSAQAVAALEEYITKAPDGRERHEAALILQEIRDTISDKT